MSTDFDDLFSTLRNDSISLRLASPSALRAAGNRRTQARRIGGVGTVAVVVAAGTAGGAYSVSAGAGSALTGSSNGNIAIASFSPPVPTGSIEGRSRETSPGGMPLTAGASSSAPRGGAAGRACGAADLKASTSAGPSTILVTISNGSPTPCDVRGFPGLVHTEPDGSTGTVPMVHRGISNPTASLPRGRTAIINIAVDSGRPDTHVTDCTKPVSYHGIALVLDGGQHVALRGLTINAGCDTVSVTSWSQAAT